MNINKLQGIISQEEFQQIATRPLPKPEELFEPLSKFHSLLYDAFGMSLVRTFEITKNTHNKKSTRMFRPQAIRFFVHDFLSQKGIPAQLVDENDKDETDDEIFEHKVISNNGIAGSIRGYEYRLLKLHKKGLPPPTTQPRKDYYSQIHLKEYKLPLPGFSDQITPIVRLKPHLIYLWDIIKTHINIYLAVPVHYLLFAESKVVLVPNPIITMKQSVVEEPVTEKIENQQTIEVKQHDLRPENPTGERV